MAKRTAVELTAEERDALPKSILDTDLYKLTMQQGVKQHFPSVQATYRFTHRDKHVYFSRECYEKYIALLPSFAELRLTEEEHRFLRKKCPYLKPEYLDYLASFRFDPSQVMVEFVPHPETADMGRIEMSATGPWVETILWEVPLMASLSEMYFLTTDRDWSYEGQEDLAYDKASILLRAGVHFSEFGTRRRRSYHTQDLVVKTLLRAEKELSCEGKGKVIGTSNVHLALKYDTTPIGTIAHEWFMGVAALRGYEHANGLALDLWEEVFPEGPRTALTDTFSTEVFYRDFTRERANKWPGLRQDSGDPYVFAPRARKMFEDLGIDHTTKSIIYSDALNMEKALGLAKQGAKEGFRVTFGIGTYLTNDFKKASSAGKEKSKALNMVIKLASVDGNPCVKISDELMKNTGVDEAVKSVKTLFGLPL